MERMRWMAPEGARRPKWIIDKMLRNIWLVGYIHMVLPRACVVHVMRHPLDVAMSCYAQPFGYAGVPWAWDLREIAAQYNATMELQRHWEEVLPGKVLVVHYEELVVDVAGVARRIAAHCEMGWEEGMLRWWELGRAVHTASVSQVRQPLYGSAVGRWRRYEGQLAEAVEAFGGTVRWYEERVAAVLGTAEGEGGAEKDEL